MLALTEIFRHPSLETLPGDSIHPYIAQAIGRCASPTPLQKSCVWLCSEQSTGIGFSCWSPVILNRCERGQLLLWSPPPPPPPQNLNVAASQEPHAVFLDPKGRRCSGNSLQAEDDKVSSEIPFLRGRISWWLGDACLGIPCWLSSS